jgi:signal transduction histidine kinase
MNSEIVDLNRDLQKKSIELKRSNDQKNYYLGVASHDLRNPLTIINFCTYKLLKMPQVSQLTDAQDLVNKIKNMSAFMNKLIQDLLDITKIDSGKFELSKIETVIPEYLQPIIDLNRIIAQNKNISIESRYGENIPRIQIDQSKIEQVINNIISNAIKYSNKDKKIMISVERKEAYVIFSVQDQGQGILPEELSKLFQPFQITSTKSTDGEKSTGLGLSIIKKIIEFHKGQVWIESEFGVGSILYFSLPIG